MAETHLTIDVEDAALLVMSVDGAGSGRDGPSSGQETGV